MSKSSCRALLSVVLAAFKISSAAAEDVVPPRLDVAGLKAMANAGDHDSGYKLGRAYLRGAGVAKDPAAALELLKPAAEAGHAEAMGAYGFMLSKGVGVPKNEAAAVEWLKKSAGLGVATSQLNLGIMTLRGNGTGKDTTAGLVLMEQAAGAGQVEAMVRLAEAWHFGEPGLERDPAKAAQWAARAAEAGSAQARNLLGMMWENGLGVEQNFTTAAGFYRQAAGQGHAKAQASLGRLLSNGRGGVTDKVEAWFWLRVSALQGESTAANFLPEFKPALSPLELEEAEKRVTEYQKKRFHARHAAAIPQAGP